MAQKKTTTTTVYAEVKEVSLLEQIAEEQETSKPEPIEEKEIEVEYQQDRCCTWVTLRTEKLRTVNGKLNIAPPAWGHRIIVNASDW